MGLEQLAAGCVVGVAAIGGSKQHAGVDDQRSATEPLGEHVLRLRGGATGARRANRDEPELASGGDVLGQHSSSEFVRSHGLARGLLG
jgi:hypothetical protein